MPTHEPSAASGPISAAAFRRKFGVNTHFEWMAEPPHPYSEQKLLLAQLALDAGIRGFRQPAFAAYGDTRTGGWVVDPNGPYHFHETMATMGQMGIRFHWVVGNPGMNDFLGDPDKIVKAIADKHAAYTTSGEAPNEYDNGPVNPNWQNPWQPALLNHMKAVSMAWYARPELSSKPYIGPSLVFNPRSSEELFAANNNTKIDGFTDGRNTHPYTGNKMDTVAYQLTEVAKLNAIHSVNEFYPTEYGSTNANPPAGGWPTISEAVQAAQIERSFLSQVRAGARLCWQYQLHDGKPGTGHEENFGLLNYDNTPKPSYNSTKALLQLCPTTEPALIKHPGHSYPNRPAELMDLTLHAADNRWLLPVWREVEYGAAGKMVSVQIPAGATQIKVHTPQQQHTETIPAGTTSFQVKLTHEARVIDVTY